VGENESIGIRLLVLHAGQCDPKKCTALKLGRFGKANILKGPFFPPGILLLDPFCPHIISRDDLPLAERKGLLALDCSWSLANCRIFNDSLKHRRTQPRSLPYLLASNPVKFGQQYRLSTLEALAAALIIIGRRRQAEDILGIYSWGKRFLELNREPLEEYEAASRESEIRIIEANYLGRIT